MFVLRQFEDVYSGGCKQDDAVLLGYTGGGLMQRGLPVDLVLSAGFCFSRYNGFTYICLSIRTRLRLPATHISRRASVQTWTEFLFKKKKKKYCFLFSRKIEIQLISKQ